MTLLSIHPSEHPPKGLVEIDGEEMYCIDRFDEIPPFLMAITSDTNLWMYLSSTGGLTAGRIDENSAIFPYETEDRLHRLRGISGPITLIRAAYEARPATTWEPFDLTRLDPKLNRRLFKSPLGNRVTFVETNELLGLTFQYTWSSCDEFGFVRTARLSNHSGRRLNIELLDGLLNLLPAGVKLITTQTSNCLLDAYKRSELDNATHLGIYSMTATLTDRAEPSECLRATAAWSRGLAGATVLLNEDSIRDFRSARPIQPHTLLTGGRGAYLLNQSLDLSPGETIEWDIVVDIGFDHVHLEQLRQWLATTSDAREQIAVLTSASTQGLRKIIASADGIQMSADRIASSHHMANVLFNTMRGGLPIDGDRIGVDDFIHFVKERNLSVYLTNESALNRWADALTVAALIREAERTGVADLIRLAHEYLPFAFGRRHGDPSRPWNRFSIDLKNPDGSRKIGYQGNWRDIFQNWEALAFSYPSFIGNLLAKFVNASTIDGFNPYRISQDGIDWEVHHPDDPWSNIGYWGDHQIIYLLKLLEASQQFHPGALRRLLARPIFSYANVPYRMNPYSLITQNPRSSISFDKELHREIENRVRTFGADGKLLLDSDGTVYHATLLEKLLVPMLSKLSNFVIDGGIWMNTQRPEWNDANNALAGNGVSMVTLCYLRRYVKFLHDLLSPLEQLPVRVSAEVMDWASQLAAELARWPEKPGDTRLRRELLDEVGNHFDTYRQKVYANGFSGKVMGETTAFLPLLRAALNCIDRTIAVNQRTDKLFHSYNLLDVSSQQKADLQALPEMLEGQVAALSSGLLDTAQSVELLQSLFTSRLWREDQQSFLLYPWKTLPSFMERNLIPAELVNGNLLLSALHDAGEASIVARDARGQFRFNGDFQHARDLEAALTRLSRQSKWQSLVVAHRKGCVEAFEKVFNHHAFTGRSGTMYAYEGIGCVYWHMVAKLLLATQEIFWKAVDADDPDAPRLAELYYRIRSGLGFNKTAAAYGAVPLDPYSHTPAVGGARQPGMTGQVKEEILTRLGEWGVRIRAGGIHFSPRLLRSTELLPTPRTFQFVGVDGNDRSLELAELSAGFTLCQTPIVYHANVSSAGVEVHRRDGTVRSSSELMLNRDESQAIFERTGEIDLVRVSIPSGLFLDA